LSASSYDNVNRKLTNICLEWSSEHLSILGPKSTTTLAIEQLACAALLRIKDLNVIYKTLIRAAAIVTMSVVSAFAADLPMSSPLPTLSSASVYDWSGFYVGASAGYGWASGGSITVDDPLNGPHPVGVSSGTGFVGGGQVGANIQSDVLVSGIEADIQYANIGSSVNWAPYGFLGLSSGSSAEYFGTLRVRGGFAIDRTFFFLTGGAAYGGLNSSPLGGTATRNLGYAFGAGAEYAFTDHWTTKLEALYISQMNSSTKTIYVTNGPNVYPINAISGSGGVLVRVGVNYKF
jgi:outer membrane immunogenic protein